MQGDNRVPLREYYVEVLRSARMTRPMCIIREYLQDRKLPEGKDCSVTKRSNAGQSKSTLDLAGWGKFYKTGVL